MAARKAKKTKKATAKKRAARIPPSPIDRMCWSGKSRRIRLRLDTIGDPPRDPDPGQHVPDCDTPRFPYEDE